MWLANQIRTDIANALRAVAKYVNKPREAHWSTAIGSSEYVFGKSDLSITFQRGRWLDLVGLADADYASKATDRRLVSGGCAVCVCVRVLVF